MGPEARSRFGSPMFEPELFRKKIYCKEERVLVTSLGLFGVPAVIQHYPQWFDAPIVAWSPGNCAPLPSFVTSLDIFPRFLENLLGSEIFFCSATAGKKTALRTVHIWLKYFAASFFKALGIQFSKEAEESDFLVVGAFIPTSFLCMEVVLSVCQSFGALPVHQATWHTRVSQRTFSRFKAFSISGRISSQLAAFPAYSVLTVRLLWWHFLPKCTSCVSGGRAGLTIGQTGQMPGASRFWGPRVWISKHSFSGFSYF